MTGTSLDPPSSSTHRASLPTPDSTASFWHTEPVLVGHRTTKHLPTQADIVIVGSGIAGAFAAWTLLGDEGVARGKQVVMLEAREACWGATGRNGGHCQPKLFNYPPHVARFELANYLFLKTFIQKHDIKCEWQDVQNVRAFLSKKMFADAISDIELMQRLDPEVGNLIQVVTPGSVSPSFEDLRLNRNEVLGAVIQKKAASVWPYKLITWILLQLLSLNDQPLTSGDGSHKSLSTNSQDHSSSIEGNTSQPLYHHNNQSGSHLAGGQRFNLQTNTPALNLQRLDDGSWIVHTSRGMIATKSVLLTTNAYTSYLLPQFSDLIVPTRLEMSALAAPSAVSPNAGTPLSGTYSYIALGNKSNSSYFQDDYLTQRPFLQDPLSGTLLGGQLMFGGGRNYAARKGIGVSNDSEIDQPVARYLRQELNTVLDLQNKGRELKASHEWSGIVGLTRDGAPWCGTVPDATDGGKGLWICAGFNGHGMPNAALSAKNVVYEMQGLKLVDHRQALPSEFWISTERVTKARRKPEVHLVDLLEQ